MVGVAQCGRNVLKEADAVVLNIDQNSTVQQIHGYGRVDILSGWGSFESDPLQALPHINANAVSATGNAGIKAQSVVVVLGKLHVLLSP